MYTCCSVVTVVYRYWRTALSSKHSMLKIEGLSPADVEVF